MRQPLWITIVVVAGFVLIAVATIVSPTAEAANDYGLVYQTVPSPTPKNLITPTSPPSATDTPLPPAQPTRAPQSSQSGSSTTATPGATAVSTPSALPTTGGNDNGGAALSLTVLALGILLLLGAFGLTSARRPRP